MQYREVNVIYDVRVKNNILFLILSLLMITTVMLTNDILMSDDLYFNLFEDQLAYDRVLGLVEASKNWRWVGYSLLPFYLLVKFSVISMCLSVGTILAGIKIGFGKLFRIVMISEFIFFIPLLIKIMWFGVFYKGYTLQDLQLYSPLSLISLVGHEDVPFWLIYPLQVVNLFELSYLIALTFGITSVTKGSFRKMLRLMSLSYGTALLLWVVFVVFLSVSISA